MNKKKPQEETKEFQIKKEELEALSARVAERKIEEDDWQRLHRYLVLLLKLTQVLEYGRVRTRKLMRILFGKRTEKEKTEEGKTGNEKNLRRIRQRRREAPMRRERWRAEAGARRNRPGGIPTTKRRNPRRKGMAAIRRAPMRMRQRSSVRFAATKRETGVRNAEGAGCGIRRRKSSSG